MATPSTIPGNYPIALAGVAVLGALLILQYWNSPWRKLPPGPRGLPVIGNLLDLRQRQWVQFTRWKETYGDVVYLSALGQSIVVLNTQKAAADLLDRRASIYSDRPRTIVANLISCGGLMLAIQSGPRWRRMRKAAHESLGRVAAGDYFKHMQKREAVQLAITLLAEPGEWDKHLERTVASVVMSVTYDTPITTRDHPAVKAVDEFMARLKVTTLPGAYLADFLPWMRYIPSRFAKWKREAEGWFMLDSARFRELFDGAVSDMAQGQDRPCFARILVENSDRNKLSIPERSWLAGTMYAAGFDTTYITLSWWVLAVVGYPETQSRAQAELDAVVGRARVPTFDNLPKLPYIRAMVREVLRWRPVGPIGVPHRSTSDDWYNGMFIPAGTMCVPNIWAINHDPTVYGADADDFNPARHLDADGELAPAAPDTKSEGHATFGYGSRVCVGRHIANSSLLVDIATMLWACRFGRAKNAHGEEMPIDIRSYLAEGTAITPIPFECNISARFPEATILLAEESERQG